MRKDERQDIYRSTDNPDAKKPFQVDSSAAGQGKKRMTRAWQMSIVVIVIMGVLLGGALYIADTSLKRGVREYVPSEAEATIPIPTNRPKNPWAFDLTDVEISDPFETLDRLEEEPVYEQVKQDPEKLASAMEHIRIARRYASNKNWDQSERYLRKALAEWPEMGLAQRTLGMILTQTGQFDKAMVVLLNALKTDPFAADAYNNLAAVYMQKGMLEEAEAMLQTALKIDPKFVSANVNMGLLYLLSGRYHWAADYLEIGVNKFPQNEHVRNNLAVSLLRTGRYEDARRHLGILIDQQPDLAYAYFNYAITYALERDFENAMAWIQKGADLCSPITFHHFISDSDFEGMRNYPAFMQLVQSVYGEMPEPRAGG